MGRLFPPGPGPLGPRAIAGRCLGLALSLHLLSACTATAESRTAAAWQAEAPAAAPGFSPPRPVLAAHMPDHDRDGLIDAYDACPGLPGMFNPVATQNGCPPPGYYDDGFGSGDRDGDLVLDLVDACPERPGPSSPNRAASGCPPGEVGAVADAASDACRAAATSEAARAARCPPAFIDGDRIRILDGIGFASGATILLESSYVVLASVSAVLSRHPEIRRVRVEGHTDARGGAVMNRGLSRRRAEAVTAWLAEHGVSRERLESDGLGFDRPIATNDTEAGRAQNRRVEFRIVSTDPAPASVGPTLASASPGAPATRPALPAGPPPVVWGTTLDGFDPPPTPIAPRAPIVPAEPAPLPNPPPAPSGPSALPPAPSPHGLLGRDIGY